PPSSGFEASSSSWADDDFEISSDDPAAQTLPPSPVTPDMTNRLSKWRFVTKLSKIFTPD
ncbi:MAG: hypothetical protein Q8P67_09125, partial [archaeon]|nr:hypothetical protein [archaeon]